MTTLFTRQGNSYDGRTCTNEKGQIGFRINQRTCGRCGGAGGSVKWAHTGWTCFDCNGKGLVSCDVFARLYTNEELIKLNARAAKADETRAAKRAEAARIEAARIERERVDVIAAHGDITTRITAVTDVNGQGFLADMYRQVVEYARPMSDAQRAAAEKTVAAFEAEHARKAFAAHIGTVGERIKIEITYVGKFDITEQWYGAPVRFIWTFRDENGSNVTYFGGYAMAFDKINEKGDKVCIAATVKSHGEYRGEPQTVIQRPKAI